jgi:hypothetical protein
MHLPHECATRSIISVAFVLLTTAFTAIASAAPETVAAVPIQNIIPAIKGDLQSQNQNQKQTQKEDSNSMFLWREADNRGRSHAALIDTDASVKRRETLKPFLSWETGEGNSYFIPAPEVPGFVILRNVFDRLAFLKRSRKERGRTTPPRPLSGTTCAVRTGRSTRTPSTSINSGIPTKVPPCTDWRDHPGSVSGNRWFIARELSLGDGRGDNPPPPTMT